MDVNRIIFEYGKAQLHIILLQEQIQQLTAKLAELQKSVAVPSVNDGKVSEKPKEVTGKKSAAVVASQEGPAGVGAAL